MKTTNCVDPRRWAAGTSFAGPATTMSHLEPLRPFAYPVPAGSLQAQVWDCFNRNQVLAAAFEVHEAAMSAGFMPDEATTLSLSLAELCAQAVTVARGGVASVFFSDAGWRLEVADSGPAAERQHQPVLHAKLPRPLASLRFRAAGTGTVVIAEYVREENE
ncbi:MAG: hypothetical protein Q8N23_06270 [Archangium sp.]|nr:hypothetical protein [Archangium sp.]MDP3152257.1 hypothetical protein [Archangium sp.]MDP3570653.1 hypothetical protein [Archangium sp.]